MKLFLTHLYCYGSACAFLLNLALGKSVGFAFFMAAFSWGSVSAWMIASSMIP